MFRPPTHFYGKTAQTEQHIQLSGTIVNETLKAILFLVEGVDGRAVPEHLQKSIWLPISQVPKTMRQSHLHTNMPDILHVKEWIWKQKINDSWDGEDPSQQAEDDVSREQAIDPDEYDDLIDDEEGPPF